MKRRLTLVFLMLLANVSLRMFAQDVPSVPRGQTASSPDRIQTVSQPSALSLTQPCRPDEGVDLSVGLLRLTADSGALRRETAFTASTLNRQSLPPLPATMLNVTGGHAGYRLLPHGEHFSVPARLELAYEPQSLPAGYRPKDIHTYYYNEQSRRWTALERTQVDTVRHVILSLTTHFTDFVNAVIKTPEMPEVTAFVPTVLTDLETPSPLSGVVMMQSPESNSHGAASATCPIEIPAGRNGLQPAVGLTYSSQNGNGLLGTGWSMPQPAIMLDTRWGVPRYDTRYESEVYTLDGQQLICPAGNPDLLLPYQTNVRQQRTGGEVTFVARDTRNCDRIIRHGTSPRDYWWEVTDRSGTVSYYGKYAADSAVNDSCVLRDDRGNIAHWALAEVVDPGGNYMRYDYLTDDSPLGRELYLKHIRYTGNNTAGLAPAYHLRFCYSGRSDVLTDCRLGFVRQTR